MTGQNLRQADEVTVTFKNEVFMKVQADPGILLEIRDAFSFRVPGYQFMPAFRTGRWDGFIRLLDLRSGEMYVGLYESLKELCAKRKWRFLPAPKIGALRDVTDLNEFIKALNLPTDLEVRDYQLDAIHSALENRRRIIVSPTGSGKSLIIYIIIRYLLDNVLPGDEGDIVLVVPTVNLVKQMFSDFEDYSRVNAWDVDANCQQIFSGQEKIFTKPVVITTWQSLIKLKHQLNKTYAVIGDEAHRFTAKSLVSIMEGMPEAEYRIATTGTLKDATVDHMVLEGLFGPIFTATTTKELQDRKLLAALKIGVMVMEYNDANRRVFSSVKYHEEIEFITKHQKRNEFIASLALQLEGNTLIMYRMIEHGKAIYDIVDSKAHKKRKIFLVNGGTPADDREALRKVVEKEKDSISVVSIGTFAEGVNIKNINNIIFASPSKSKVKVLQSIGRGLRVGEDGRGTLLFDIADDLSWKSKKNHTLRHLDERIRLYASEQFAHTLHAIRIE